MIHCCQALPNKTGVLFIYRRFGTVGVKQQDITGRDQDKKRR